MTGPVIANVFIGEGGTSSNDGTRTKVSRSKVTLIMMRLTLTLTLGTVDDVKQARRAGN